MLLDPTRKRLITDRIRSHILVYLFTVLNGEGDFLDLYIDFYTVPRGSGCACDKWSSPGETEML
jgi:hypothetical protein